MMQRSVMRAAAEEISGSSRSSRESGNRPPRSKGAPSTLDRARAKRCLLTALLTITASVAASLGASDARAIYVDFDAITNSAESQSLEIEGLEVSVEHRARVMTATQGGPKWSMVTKTIVFEGGPVLLGSVDIENAHGKTFAMGAEGMIVVTGGETVDRFVSSITTINMVSPRVLRSLAANGVNVRPRISASPVPEPGAALLFVAGISVVSVTSRRER